MSWKKNSWEEEVTKKLPPKIRNPPTYPQAVEIQVEEVAHITHFEQFREIIDGGILKFKPEAKLSRTNSYIKQDSSVISIAPNVALLPGKYSWWGIELPSGFPPPPLLNNGKTKLRPILSPLFKLSESIYGTVKIKTRFSELKISYCESRLASLERSIDPRSVEVGFKIGGTLVYKREICFVIIMYMKGDPRAEVNLNDYPHFDFENKLSILRPFSGVELGQKHIKSSWDIYVFALFFPLEESFLQLYREQVSVSCVSHFIFDSNGKKITEGSLEDQFCHSHKKHGCCPDEEHDSILI